MLWPKPAKSFRPGDRVIFSTPRHGANPGIGAKDVRPEPNGEGYRYIVEDFWIVANTNEAQVVVKTRQGRTHVLDAADARMRVASWWQRLIHHHRFPKRQPGTPQRSLPA
jgi:hypothetical protein